MVTDETKAIAGQFGPFETFSLSSWGGGYEDTCQRMLWRGVGYLAEVHPPVEMWADAKSYSGIYGVIDLQNDELKALEAAMMRGEPDVTGAQHQCVMGHLAYIHKNGLDVWRETMRQLRTADECFEWSGSL